MSGTKDFVYVSDGVFHRDFEGLYQNIPDPWRTEEDPYGSFARALQGVQKAICCEKVNSFYEIGCGKACHLSDLSKANPHVKFGGCDISETAISLGKSRFPDIAENLHVLDIRASPPPTPADCDGAP